MIDGTVRDWVNSRVIGQMGLRLQCMCCTLCLSVSQNLFRSGAEIRGNNKETGRELCPS